MLRAKVTSHAGISRRGFSFAGWRIPEYGQKRNLTPVQPSWLPMKVSSNGASTRFSSKEASSSFRRGLIPRWTPSSSTSEPGEGNQPSTPVSFKTGSPYWMAKKAPLKLIINTTPTEITLIGPAEKLAIFRQFLATKGNPQKKRGIKIKWRPSVEKTSE